jgi:hypothetical protein
MGTYNNFYFLKNLLGKCRDHCGIYSLGIVSLVSELQKQKALYLLWGVSGT